MKKPKLPTLPNAFTDNLEAIAAGLHGRPINLNYAHEWKITDKDCKDLLEFMEQSGMIGITWLPEKNARCFVKKGYLIN